jgi:anti-sigma factor RsiW
MNDHEHKNDIDNDELRPSEAALTRLADGSLPESEREQLRAEVAGSPELQARLHEQQRAVSLLQATSGIAAPATLRASVEELANGSRERSRRRSRERSRRATAADRGGHTTLWRPRGSLGIVALAVVVIAVISVTLHGRTAPTVGSTARLALAPATGRAPSLSPGDHDLLSLRAKGASGIPFPSYVGATGWRASGTRHDTLQGRQVTTVFYSIGGARVGYSIVSGAALAMPHGSTVRGPSGVRYVLVSSGGAQIITWRRAGHTCVIAGRSISRSTLLALAAADERV